MIDRDLYKIKDSPEPIQFDFLRKNSYLTYEKYLKGYIIQEGYDWTKTQMITAMIFINIAPLHHDPYCHLLFNLGRFLLQEGIDYER